MKNDFVTLCTILSKGTHNTRSFSIFDDENSTYHAAQLTESDAVHPWPFVMQRLKKNVAPDIANSKCSSFDIYVGFSDSV